DRSLVDRTRIRWGGFGDVLLGLVLVGTSISGANVAGIIAGLLLLALGGATWSVTGFGNIPYLTLTPGKRAIVVFGSVGFIMLFVIIGMWQITNKIIGLVLGR